MSKPEIVEYGLGGFRAEWDDFFATTADSPSAAGEPSAHVIMGFYGDAWGRGDKTRVHWPVRTDGALEPLFRPATRAEFEAFIADMQSGVAFDRCGAPRPPDTYTALARRQTGG